MKKKLLALLCLVLILALTAASALAVGIEDVFRDETAPAADADCSVFSSGQTIRTGGSIAGIQLAAGYDVTVGSESPFVMAAGYTVKMDGISQYDAMLAGYDIRIGGAVARDVFAASNSICVDGEIGRNLYAAASSVSVNGKICGDAYISADKITLAPNAAIAGTLHYPAGATLVQNGALIGGEDVDESSVPAQDPAPAKSGFNIVGKLMSFLGLVALAFVLLWLTPAWEALDRKYAGAPFSRYAAAFGIGCAVLAGLPVVAVILMLTRLGVRLAFVLLLVYAAAIVAAPVFLCATFGRLIWRNAAKKASCYWLELPIGILCYCLVTLIPVVGLLCGFIATAFGVGAVTLLLGKKSAAPQRPAIADAAPICPPAEEKTLADAVEAEPLHPSDYAD